MKKLHMIMTDRLPKRNRKNPKKLRKSKTDQMYMLVNMLPGMLPVERQKYHQTIVGKMGSSLFPRPEVPQGLKF